ncbi:MAG: L-aspartate oxidase [Syntrophus sp. PtaU1.Bin208]|nr:MAG: L-aspartate oxidase [Syntrophus sp. PtaU1.Bin208]
MNSEIITTEILIIGSGLAGLRAALEASKIGKKVIILTKSKITDSNTLYAQGGITGVDPARVASGKDSYESLIQNTLAAGDGLCKREVVDFFSYNSYEAIKFLMEQDVPFSKDANGWVLHQEGGHDHERIYCVADYTGKAIEETLVNKVLEDPNIKVYEYFLTFTLITKRKLRKDPNIEDRCLGVYAIDRINETVITFKANAVILATGGAGRVFQYTSNPENATGDGIAMAYNVGAKIANMEFFQFHPTVLYEPFGMQSNERRFLLTEALRGVSMGGILTTGDDSKEDFVLNYDPDGSHATRDKVSQAIDAEMKKSGLKHVYLNVTTAVTGKSPDYIREHFPQIYAHCLNKGIDITVAPIPVVPAAHYTCGGVLVDLRGRTSIPGLFAIGEVSCTGLMGANRLASNSLTEAALFGKLAADEAIKFSEKENSEDVPLWYTPGILSHADVATVNQIWDVTRSTMMSLCGIDRTEERLRAAVGILESLYDTINKIYWGYYPNDQIFETRNLIQTAKLIAQAALFRKESRGGHFRSDYPRKVPGYEAMTLIQYGAEMKLVPV